MSLKSLTAEDAHDSAAAATAPIRRHQSAIAVTAVLVLAAACVWFFLFHKSTEQTSAPAPGVDLAWYSLDDGQSWFAEKRNRLKYVTRDGKPAYRCWVYTCDGGKTKFAAYLERYAPEAQKQLEAIIDGKRKADPAILEQISANGSEVKKPGAGSWISIADPRAAELRDPACPKGSNDRPQLVPPLR